MREDTSSFRELYEWLEKQENLFQFVHFNDHLFWIINKELHQAQIYVYEKEYDLAREKLNGILDKIGETHMVTRFQKTPSWQKNFVLSPIDHQSWGIVKYLSGR